MERLAARLAQAGGFLSRTELSKFDLGGGRTQRLMDTSKGIWNPRDLSATLSIVSSPDGPYDDRDVEGGLFRYDYRAGSIHGDNAKLRRAGELGLPLILLRKITNGVYIPIFPVYVVADDPPNRQFVVAVDESLKFLTSPTALTEVERSTPSRSPADGSTKPCSAAWSCAPTRCGAPCAAFATAICWTRPISPQTPMRRDSRSSATA